MILSPEQHAEVQASRERTQITLRNTAPGLEAIMFTPTPVLDKGFIRVVDYMGDQDAVVQAARVSYGLGTKTPSDDVGLLRYLMRHQHTTPFEMCEIKLHVKLPIFVARQWIRHRMANVNEYSARYSIMLREFHIPSPGDLAPQSQTNKQGRSGSYSEPDHRAIQKVMEDIANGAFDAYEGLIGPDDDGGYNLARETAREVLPLSTYTEWYWKTDLHNLLRFLKLRADRHAQQEIRAYAKVICGMVEGWVPDIYAAFEDYSLYAHTFSQKEMSILSEIVNDSGLTPNHYRMIGELPKREREAFYGALGIDMEDR